MSALLFVALGFVQAQEEALQKARQAHAEAMAQISFLLGDFQPKAEALDPQSGKWQEQEFPAGKKGLVRVEKESDYPSFSIKIPGSTQYHGTVSYDVFQNKYRLVFIDNAVGLLDVYEGQLVEGTLQFTNLKAGTFFTMGEQRFFARAKFQPQGKSGWNLSVELSSDEGRNWSEFFRLSTSPDS